MNEKPKNICFFSLSSEEMERFDDKNSLKGGFSAISGAYIGVSNKTKKAVMNYSWYKPWVGLP